MFLGDMPGTLMCNAGCSQLYSDVGRPLYCPVFIGETENQTSIEGNPGVSPFMRIADPNQNTRYQKLITKAAVKARRMAESSR